MTMPRGFPVAVLLGLLGASSLCPVQLVGQTPPPPDQIIETVNQDWGGAAWVNVTRRMRLFNDSGLQNGTQLYDWSGSVWVPTGGARIVETIDGGLNWLVAETWSDGSWTPVSRRHLEYDEDGRLTAVTRQTYSGFDWMNQSRDLIENGDAGPLVERTETWDGSDWQPRSEISWEYDDLGRPLIVTRIDLSGETARNDSRTLYEYVITGQLDVTRTTSQIGDGDGWINERRFSESLDPNGNRVEDITQYWRQGEWSNDSRTTRSYTDSNSLLLAQEYSFPNGATDWVPGAFEEWMYDESDRPTTRVSGSWSDGQRLDDTRATYSYSDDGDRTDIVREQFTTGNWEFTVSQYSIFDQRENLIEEGLLTWDGSGFVNETRSLNTYAVDTRTSDDELPTGLLPQVLGNYPNPFVGSTQIEYRLATSGPARLEIVDVIGRVVAVIVDEDKPAGTHATMWYSSSSPGLYFVRLSHPTGTTSHGLVVSN